MMLSPIVLTPDRSLARRMLGAALLDRATYEDVEADPGAAPQALLVVGLVSVALAIGSGSIFVASLALLAWASWALVTFEVGTRLLPARGTHSDVGELLRTLAFSAAPGIIVAAAVVPFLAAPAMVIGAVWMLVSMIVAVRQALGYASTTRAVLVCLVGWILSLALVLVFSVWWGATAS